MTKKGAALAAAVVTLLHRRHVRGVHGVGLVLTSIVISPDVWSSSIGASVQLTATAYDQFGNAMPGQTFVWASSDPLVATVDSDGLVSLLDDGSFVITATVDAVFGESFGSVSSSSNAGTPIGLLLALTYS
jgi:large repetitive protein